MSELETVINTLEHISTTALPAPQMRRIIRELLLGHLYKMRNKERETYLDDFLGGFGQ